MEYVFSYGLGQNTDSWNDVVSNINILNDENNSVIIPSFTELLYGSVATYKNLYYGFSKLCDELYAENSECLNLCGLSLGAILCLNYTIENREKVKSQILIAPQYKMPKIMLRLQNLFLKRVSESDFNGSDFNKDDFIKLTSSLFDLDFSKDLPKVNCDTLIICGEKDSSNIRASKSLNKKLFHSELKIIANCGHQINEELPLELAECINNFYANK